MSFIPPVSHVLINYSLVPCFWAEMNVCNEIIILWETLISHLQILQVALLISFAYPFGPHKNKNKKIH